MKHIVLLLALLVVPSTTLLATDGTVTRPSLVHETNGDFDADGRLDRMLVDGVALRFELANGAIATRSFAGPITALATGELGRRDGITDLAVAVETAFGSRLWLYQSPTGVLGATPRSTSLPGVANALLIGRFDRRPGGDVLAAVEDQLLLVDTSGRWVDRASVSNSVAGLERRAARPGGQHAVEIITTEGRHFLLTEGDGLSEAWNRAVEIETETVVRLGGPFVVTSPADTGDVMPGDGTCDIGTGECTLRAAIDESNALGGLDTILFDLTGAPFITPMVAPLVITDPVILDATSQPTTGAVEIDGSMIIGVPACDVLVEGGSSTITGLVFTASSVCLDGAGGNVLEGNFFGVDPSVTTPTIGSSLRITSASNTVGGTTVAARNYFVDSMLTVGTDLFGATAFDNRVIGNYFGVDPTGMTTIGSGYGLSVSSGSVASGSNDIGGTLTGEGNVLAGTDPIVIFGAATTGNLVQGNRIGVHADGTAAFAGTSASGVIITDTSSHTVGGGVASAANVIAGNTSADPGNHGVWISGTTSDLIRIVGNFIGTDITGSTDLGGYEDGVFIEFASTNSILGNVISGNEDDGVDLRGLSGQTGGNTIRDNIIGTNADATSAIPNGDDGISNENATATVIGGSVAGQGNVIAGNLGDGIDIFQSSAPVRDVLVRGNAIGTDSGGSIDLGNGGYGVLITAAEESVIGGTAAGEGNRIANNGEDGIGIINFGAFADENLLSGNLIHDNAGLAIDLDANGITMNDPGDGDSGSNEGQNFPVLTGADADTGTVTGTLDSTASTTFTIELFANDSCDPSGNGEAERFLGHDTVTTDGSGDASFSLSGLATFAIDDQITATATDPLGNTSELSTCFAATGTGILFTDGFESGDTSMWSLTVD